MKEIGTTALLALLVVGLAITAIPATKATSSDDWTLIAQQGLKAYPDLMETVWEANVTTPPYGPYDMIGLDRVVKVGIQPIGVLFICPGTWSSGGQLLSNPPTDSWTTTENYDEALYWANRGFDVYSIDYRTHFVPPTLNASQLSFMANWGWDQWIGDIKQAVDKVKIVSGAERIYMAGQSFGGIAAMNYATLYGVQDLKGLILLDPAALGLISYLGIKNPSSTNSYNLTDAIAQMNATGTWAIPADSGELSQYQYGDQYPSAPAPYPYNYTFPNITAFLTQFTYYAAPPWGTAGISNLYGGYGNATVVIHTLATFDPYWPTLLGLQTTAYSDWTNCPYVTYDFDDHYSDIAVPILVFQSQFFGNSTYGPFKDGIANPDFTATILSGYGHLDVFSGVYCESDVSAPTYDWMVSHMPPVHNVAVTNFTSKTVVGQDISSSINVTVVNQGDFPELSNVTLYVNTTAMGTQAVSLTNGSSTTVTFIWNTTGADYGNYTITTVANPITNETHTLDNTLVKWIVVTIPGDITGDFKVNLADLVALAQAYNSRPGDVNWNLNADIEGNGIVGLADLVILAQHYGQHYP